MADTAGPPLRTTEPEAGPPSARQPAEGTPPPPLIPVSLGERAAGSVVAQRILAVLGVLAAIYFARAILMPFALAVTLALLFRPVVRRLRRSYVPDWFSAGLCLVAAALTIGTAALYLIGPAKEWIDNAPTHLRDAGRKLHVVREQIERINEATEEVQDLADGSVEEPVDPYPFTEEPHGSSQAPRNGADEPSIVTEQVLLPGTLADGQSPHGPGEGSVRASMLSPSGGSDDEVPVPVEVRQPRLTTGLAVVSSTGGVLAEIVVTVVLAYFLLSSGDVLINNVLRILPTFRDKRSAVELVYSIERGVSSYLLIVTCINIGLGCVMALAMWALGLPNPLLWGAMAAILNYIPFLGAMVGAVVVFLVAVLSFDTLSYAALAPVVYFAINAIEGNLLTPTLLGRSMSLNPIMVFLSLTFWGWMWGVGGAVLAVPIMAALKVGCDQFERTRPIGTLLGGEHLA